MRHIPSPTFVFEHHIMQSLYFAPCRPAPVGVTAGRRVLSVVARATALPTEVRTASSAP